MSTRETLTRVGARAATTRCAGTTRSRLRSRGTEARRLGVQSLRIISSRYPVPLSAGRRANRSFSAEQYRAQQERPLLLCFRVSREFPSAKIWKLSSQDSGSQRSEILARLGRECYSVRFVNPYRAASAAASEHVCSPIAPDDIQAMTSSLTYNTFLEKFVLVGVAAAPHTRTGDPRGIYFSTSDDLLHWQTRRLIARVELPWTYRCGDRNPVLHPSVIDPNSRTRNFQTVGRHAYLYFVRYHYVQCRQTQNCDLVRLPIEFSR